MFSPLELLRLVAAAAVIFAIIPYFVFGRQLARGAVHAAFFLQVLAMVLGDWKLFLPGSAAAFYICWCIAAAWAVRRRRMPVPSAGWGRLFEMVEAPAPALAAPVECARHLLGSPVPAAIAVIAAATGLRGAWFALHHARLLHLESYTRALSLHTLMRGDLWDHDPAVALLAPVAWLSGVTPDAAIRYSGALAGVALVLAVAFAGWRRLNSPAGAVWSAAIFASSLIGLNLVPMEATGAEWSAVFVILAAGLAGTEWGLAVLSLVTAALLHLGISPVVLLAPLAIVLASMLPSVTARVPALGAAVVLFAALLTPPPGVTPEPQYEAAARVAHRIAREFRANDWVVVSPGLEVAQTYGRGWHVELADFVAAYSENQVADAGFVFPYSTQSVFIFVEKRVLDQPVLSFAWNSGSTPYYYQTRLGRASLEYRAARLMAFYRASHPGTVVYHEDDDLIVYRIERAAAARRLTAAAGPEFQ